MTSSLAKSAQRPACAAIYARISSDGAGSGLGVKRQEQDCRELAEARGWPIDHVFVDNDVSAYSGKRRPEYSRMLAAIESGEVDGVLTWHLDRLTRRPAELEQFFEVCDKAGVKDMACVSGDIDLSSADGQFHARILGAVARKESDDKSRRIRRKHRELAEAGQHPGSWAMLGYTYDKGGKVLRIVPKEARVVRRIFAMYLEGAGLREIARWINDQGLVGKRGRTRWTNSAVVRILDNPTFAGFRRYEGELIRGTNWKPIIEPQTWEQTQALRAASKADTPAANRTGKGAAMLSGLIYCACGQPMYRGTYRAHDERSTYLCRRSRRKGWGSCEEGGISALRAERLVSEAFLERVSGPYAQRVGKATKAELAPPENVPEDLDARLAHLEHRMERLLEVALEAPGPLAAKKVKEKAAAIEAERAELAQRAAKDLAGKVGTARRAGDVEALRARVGDLPGVYKVATLDERRAMLRLGVERVSVRGTGRPKRVEVEWADWLQT